jgi:hypothetical protein
MKMAATLSLSMANEPNHQAHSSLPLPFAQSRGQGNDGEDSVEVGWMARTSPVGLLRSSAVSDDTEVNLSLNLGPAPLEITLELQAFQWCALRTRTGAPSIDCCVTADARTDMGSSK